MATKQKKILSSKAPEAAPVEPAATLSAAEVLDTGDNTGRAVPLDTDLVAECFGDLESFKTEIGALLKSPNPLTLYRQ